MNREIIQQVIEEMQELCIKKGIKERNIEDLNICFRVGIFEIGCKILSEIYEEIEEAIYNENKKTKKYKIIKKDKKSLITSIGEVKFKRRLYKSKEGKNIYLFDRYMQIRKNARYTVDAEAKAMEEIIKTSYRRGGKNASITKEFMDL